MTVTFDSKHTVLVFPGQGSQRAEMRDQVEAHAPELIEVALGEMDCDPFGRISEGTAYQQPALYCAAIAGWRSAGSPQAEWLVGHSLGELAAAAAAGAISTEDGLRLAITRGRVMQEAAEADPGGMLAVLGETNGVSALANSLGLTVANDNAPDQIVLSGPSSEITEARTRFKEAGVRTVRLPVAGAFHSPAMTVAVPEFRAALAEIEVTDRPQLISSVTAGPFTDLRAGLLAALTRPVRWRETVLRLRDLGASRFLETGPGEVLTGLVRRTIDGIDAAPLSSLVNSPETADV